jgi:AcrR family transcriptional regulator
MPKDTFFRLPEEKREKLTLLAAQEFAAQPYGQASISRMVAKLGIAKGSIYQYFEDKFDLYRWLLAQAARERAEIASSAMSWPESQSESVVLMPLSVLERIFLVDLYFALIKPLWAQVAERVLDLADEPRVQALHSTYLRTQAEPLARLLAEVQQQAAPGEPAEAHLAAHFLTYALRPWLRRVVPPHLQDLPATEDEVMLELAVLTRQLSQFVTPWAAALTSCLDGWKPAGVPLTPALPLVEGAVDEVG